MFYYNLSHRISWAGIFAGLLIGIVVWLMMLAFGIIIASIVNLDLMGTGIVGIVWAALSVLVTAYIAGMAAMFVTKTSLNDINGQSGVHVSNWQDANIVDILTGCIIVIATTYLSFAGVTSVINGIENVVVETTEEVSRNVTSLSALLWLVTSSLTIFAAIWGAQAVLGYKNIVNTDRDRKNNR